MEHFYFTYADNKPTGYDFVGSLDRAIKFSKIIAKELKTAINIIDSTNKVITITNFY